MSDSFFEFFHKDRPPVDPESPEWETISFKEYSRSPRVVLPKPRLLKKITFELILKNRKTERNFSNKPLSLDTLGALFFWSAGLIHKSDSKKKSFRRPYPSGGARFPVEIYLALFNGEGIKAGVYHYNFLEHSLELIECASPENLRQALPYDFSKKAAGLVLLSFIGERTIKKYGSLGYKLGFIEAGHIGQNIYLVGASLGLGVLALGGMDYNMVHRELGFDDNDNETMFYQLAIGWP